jgi:polysaccharide export outer membrane protein
MKKRTAQLIYLTLFIITLSSCNYGAYEMFKTPKDFKFDNPPTNDTVSYILQPFDIIDFKLYANEGFKLIDLSALTEANTSMSNGVNGVDYLIENDGRVKLPILGYEPIAGKTIKQAEAYLEKKYAQYYKKPFARIKILNRRVTVFPGGIGSGSQSRAKVITLKNENTSLFEVLGDVGGPSALSKVKRVKVIRGDLSNPQVFLFDLSTIDGVKKADIILQNNDIVYVEPIIKPVRQFVSDVAPIVSLLTSTITLIVVLNSLKK